MTEDEAKTKTCHKTLAPVASGDGSAPWFSCAACIGSDCMAWRTFPASEWNEHRKMTDGFCGLAGKP